MNGSYLTAGVLSILAITKSRGSFSKNGSKPISHFLIGKDHGWNPDNRFISNSVAPVGFVSVSVSDYPVAKYMGMYQKYSDFHNALFLEFIKKIQRKEERTGVRNLNTITADRIYFEIRKAWERILKEKNKKVQGKYGISILPIHFQLSEFPYISFAGELETEMPVPEHVTHSDISSIPPGRTGIGYKLIDMKKTPMVIPGGLLPEHIKSHQIKDFNVAGLKLAERLSK